MHDSHTIFRKTADDKRQITVHLLNKGATIAGISLNGFGKHSQSDVVLSYPSPTSSIQTPITLAPLWVRLRID